MVYLAALALALFIGMNSGMERLANSASDTLTIQIPSRMGGRVDQPSKLDERTVDQVIAILKGTNGVEEITVTSAEETKRLLDPWFGNSIDIESLPLPRLIDVSLDRNTYIDLDALRLQIQAIAPRASLDDHQIWVQRLVRIARSIKFVAGFILCIVSGAAIGCAATEAASRDPARRGAAWFRPAACATPGEDRRCAPRRAAPGDRAPP